MCRERQRDREVGRIAQATKHKTQEKGFLKNHRNKSPKCQNPPVWGTKEGQKKKNQANHTQPAQYFKSNQIKNPGGEKLIKDQNVI